METNEAGYDDFPDSLNQGPIRPIIGMEAESEASSPNYNSGPKEAQFQIWALAASLAVTFSLQ